MKRKIQSRGNLTTGFPPVPLKKLAQQSYNIPRFQAARLHQVQAPIGALLTRIHIIFGTFRKYYKHTISTWSKTRIETVAHPPADPPLPPLERAPPPATSASGHLHRWPPPPPTAFAAGRLPRRPPPPLPPLDRYGLQFLLSHRLRWAALLI
jgi:hypothetical protein